jgi:3-oxoadipate enol-lactonase
MISTSFASVRSPAMFVDANGTMLYAEQVGGGPSLVFVHGMCGDARVWADQVGRLAGRCRCTTYDRRGHTRSPRTDAVDTVELHADDLAALVIALDIGPVIVVGSSGGARVSLDFVRRYPHLVRGAVLSEPPVGALAPDEFSKMFASVAPLVRAAAETDGPRAAVDAFFAAICPGLWSQADESTKDRYRDNADMLFADLGMPPYGITQEQVGAITTPALVIAGEQSHPALRTGAQNLADWLPDSRFVELDCGHVTYAEQPAAFAEAVTAFVSEIIDQPLK